MNAETERYVRITRRLISGLSSAGDEASQALNEVLERRIVEALAADCAPHVEADSLSQRLSQAMQVPDE